MAQVDTTWAGFMKWAEITVCADGSQGRGWNVICSLTPLLPSHPPLPEWKGSSTAYWMRIQTWMNLYASGALKERVKKSLLKALRQDKHDFDMEGVRLCDFRAALHDTLTGNAQLEEAQSQLVMEIARTAEKQLLSHEQLQYKQWVETACEGGMKGLYKAIKSPETNLLRPYRDKIMEIRPHLRRAEWRDLWIGPKPDGGPLQAALEKLKAAAARQRQTWATITPKMLRKAIKQMSDKTGGPDGLTVPMLKNLSEPQIEEMAGRLNSWELTGEMPQAVTTSLVAMLPKKIDKERPIALTFMAYRAWCKVRWDKFQQWSAEYSVTSPWDRAQKGSSSLDISLKRLITYEGIRARQRHGITLLLDLKEFYEHVDLNSLITQASCHGFPAVLLQGALQVYTGPRYIQGESCLSAPVRAERGIMAGCPFAVGLSKLALHPVMQELWRHPALSHLDLFVDDSGYDVEHHSPEKCASNAYRIWKEVQAQFKKIDMPVSIKKTAWVCSSKQFEDKLTGYLGPDDPTIQPLWSELGVDCAAGKRRRVTQHKQRIAKRKQRATRLAKLRAGAGRHPTVKANRASIMGTALYGQEAVGLAPKRMKWLRQTTAVAHGRMKLGSTELVLDEVSGKYPDPSYVVIAQQFRTLRRLLQNGLLPKLTNLRKPS